MIDQPVTREVEALQGSGEQPGRHSNCETGCLQYGDGSRAGLAGAPGDKLSKVSESIPVGPTSENLIAFESVSTPLGRQAGVVGDGGEKIREEGVGRGPGPSRRQRHPRYSRYTDGR